MPVMGFPLRMLTTMNSVFVKHGTRKECQRCGEMFIAGMGGGKYCLICRDVVREEQNRNRRTVKRKEMKK